MSSPAFTSANWKIRIYQTTYRAKHRSRMTIIGKPTANPMTIIGKPTANPMTIIGNPEAPPTATTGKPAANPTAAIDRLPTYHTAPRPEKPLVFFSLSLVCRKYRTCDSPQTYTAQQCGAPSAMKSLTIESSAIKRAKLAL